MNEGDLVNSIKTINDIEENELQSFYNFDDTMEYYDNRNEYKYVGIIDKEINRRQSKRPDEIEDVFKIREKREKILEKKRGTGIPSFKGAVCTSKSKEHLFDIANDLGINMKTIDSNRTSLCKVVKEKLLYLEKYSTGKNKKTYMMIPFNHPIYKFPLNLEDRCEYVKNKVNNILNKNIKFKENNNKNKSFDISFTLSVVPDKNDIDNILKLGFVSDKSKLKWNIVID